MRKSAPVFGKRNHAITNLLLPSGVFVTSSGFVKRQSEKHGVLPEIWLKAAMLGSLWASVEIILGSFLHNLHIPLSGTFLASLGLILMINGHKIWPGKGLFWRTALVTAAMKSISPSAIIFGPMVGIFMEGLILEVFVRMFRGKWLGFVIGGAFAVSWSLFQKIFVLLLTYGPDFVALYEQLYFMASKSFGFEGAVPFDLVKAIFIVDLSFGALVAALAYRVTGSQRLLSFSPASVELRQKQEDQLSASETQSYSLLLLLVNFVLLLAGLTGLNDLSLLLGAAFVALYVVFNILRYSRSMKRLKNPRLWVQLFIVMGLSGILLGGWSSQAALLSGLETGVTMAIRALLVIFGLSALSIEIRNPIIINWFAQRGLGLLFQSLSVAFEVLPRLMKLVAEKQRIWRHPFRILNELLGALEILRREHLDSSSKVVILTGDQGSGKTQLVKSILSSQSNHGFEFSGFYSEGTWVNGERDHYHIVDFKHDKSELLCERDGPESEVRAGPFNFRQTGIDFGCQIINAIPESSENHVVIIDEIGPLELRDTGWSACMGDLIARNQPMIWTVRPSLIDEVVKKWAFQFFLIDVQSTDTEEVLSQVKSFLG